MNYDRNTNTETSKRNTMESLCTTSETLSTKLSEKFGLRDLPYPKTVQVYENG